MILATVEPQLDLNSKTDEWWAACFKYQFHVDEKTPLPQHSFSRHVMVLKEMERARRTWDQTVCRAATRAETPNGTKACILRSLIDIEELLPG